MGLILAAQDKISLQSKSPEKTKVKRLKRSYRKKALTGSDLISLMGQKPYRMIQAKYILL